jgi:signal transduction histidine kinase
LDVTEVQKAARRAAGLTRQLLVFSRQRVASATVLDINACVRNAERLLSSTVGIDIQLRCQTTEDPYPVRADAGELELLLMNLAINGRDAMPYGGDITVTVDIVELDALDGVRLDLLPGTFARINVRDNGEGMNPEVAAKAFEPFFTTKETGRGAGLGLSMVYGIARRSGGTASISTGIGKGTTITVLFPLVRHEEAQGRDHLSSVPSQSIEDSQGPSMAEAMTAPQ